MPKCHLTFEKPQTQAFTLCVKAVFCISSIFEFSFIRAGRALRTGSRYLARQGTALLESNRSGLAGS